MHIRAKNLESPTGDSKRNFTISINIFNKAVATVISAVDHSKRTAVICIPESKEAMLQQIHLQDSLLTGHGPEAKLLDPDDAQIILGLLRNK